MSPLLARKSVRKNNQYQLTMLPRLTLIALIAGISSTTWADGPRNPAGIPGQLEEANQEKEARLPFPGLDSVFQPWYDGKARLQEKIGLNFSIAYSPLYQYATTSITGKDQASGGIFETIGTWDLLGRDSDQPGRLGFRVEGRHQLWNSITPQTLFTQVGAGVPTGLAYGEFDISLAELWWEQEFIKDRLSIRFGKMLPFGYFDFFPYKNPKTAFGNAVFALNPSIAWPQFGLGISGEYRPREDIYVVAGLHDANGAPTRAGFDTFFDDQEYFKIVELGWDPGYLKEGKKNPLASDFHITAWHTDAREAAGRPEGWGVSATASKPIDDLTIFGRYGYSDGGAALLKHVVMAGVGINGAFGWQQDTLGIAVGAGEPSASGLDTQFTAEIYSRMQITKRLSITPSIQLIGNPSANPDEDAIAIFGIRARINL